MFGNQSFFLGSSVVLHSSVREKRNRNGVLLTETRLLVGTHEAPHAALNQAAGSVTFTVTGGPCPFPAQLRSTRRRPWNH